MSRVVIHFGLHKTGTTTLQEQYFPYVDKVNLLTTLVPEMKKFANTVVGTDPLYFDPEEARGLLRTVLVEDKINLISNESFSGPTYVGLIDRGVDHRSPILENIYRTFPDAKAILVLRRQDGLAQSLYRQYIKSGGTRKVGEVYGIQGGEVPACISLNRFKYSPYVDEFLEKYQSKALILPFEELVFQPTRFLDRFSEFVGVERKEIVLKKENATRMGPLGMEVCRVLNHLFRNQINRGILPGVPVKKYGKWQVSSPVSLLQDNWPFKGGKKNVGDVEKAAKNIFDMMKKDNQYLDEKYNLGLKAYEYY